jgi:hypothetical protein
VKTEKVVSIRPKPIERELAEAKRLVRSIRSRIAKHPELLDHPRIKAKLRKLAKCSRRAIAIIVDLESGGALAGDLHASVRVAEL